jgi:hypothetical protein
LAEFDNGSLIEIHLRRRVGTPSWPDLFRPSTSLIWPGYQDVDARDERGHDELKLPAAGEVQKQTAPTEPAPRYFI